jgi:hypothetical protein
MKVGVTLVAVLSTLGLSGCGNDCGMTFPARHLLSVSDTLQCCGDAKHYEVAQADNASAMDIALQAAAATNGGPIAGLTLSVAIGHCEAARQEDCTPVADQTTPSKAAGDYAVASEATASVSGRNIRLVITVTNNQSIAGKLYLDVTQGKTCPAPF